MLVDLHLLLKPVFCQVLPSPSLLCPARPEERSEQDIRIIFEELLHVKAFAQLSHAVKKELAACIVFDSYKGMSGHVCE